MATEDVVLIGAGYVATQLFGKTLAEMGEDLNKLYKANRDKILAKATKKVQDPNDGAKPNLRVARDVIWNGVVTDDEVCAEYFGGLLASSRSEDGKDDSALNYVDCIKALSAKQLHLHFITYWALQRLTVKAGKIVNVAMQSEVSSLELWFATFELERRLGLNPAMDLPVLHRQGLLSSYATNRHEAGDKYLPYTKISPSTFGVMLYAAASNKLKSWLYFHESEFDVEPEIPVPSLYASTLRDLAFSTGLVPSTNPPNGMNP